MQLARAAAARTLTDWAEPEAPPTAEPLSEQAAQPHPDRETALTNPVPRRPAGQAATTAPHKPTDPAVRFTRLAATVRDCIALEARLAAGAAGAPRDRTLPVDPRRAPLREALRLATENYPDRADLNREAATRLDEQLAADPEKTIDPGHLLLAICDELGIELDLATLPDEFLFALSETADQDKNVPEPRATSPP